MRRRQAILGTALAAALALAIALTREGDRRVILEPLPAGYFGVAGHVLGQMAGDGELGLLDRHLGAVAGVGATFVRADVAWPRVQPEPPQPGAGGYDFSEHDALTGALARHGLRWYPVAVGTPGWAVAPERLAAGCSTSAPPADPEAFAELMAAVARRYGRSGSFWREHPRLPYRPVVEYELWNEPNLAGFWCPAPEPAAYAELVARAAPRIRAIDPGATIVLGGLAPFDEDDAAQAATGVPLAVPDFLEQAVASRPDLPELVDAVGVHLYAPDAAAAIERLAWFRSTLDAAGFAGTPISVNEVGWPTQGQGGFVNLTEEQRASSLRAVTRATALSGCRVESFAPHTWTTPEADPADQEDWFGIADPATAAPYPTALAFAEEVDATPIGERLEVDATQAVCAG